jgi:trimethylamine:corrinoid methyltransferase-like protein
MPSAIIDRDSIRGWKESGGLDTFGRARQRVDQLLASYTRPELDAVRVAQLHAYVLELAKKAGMDKLPDHELAPVAA